MKVSAQPTNGELVRALADMLLVGVEGYHRTYEELADWTSRLAHALVDDLKIKPGNRVLIRSANNPPMVACWLAATKVGAVVINTMPLLRAGELAKYVDKAEISHALCDTRLMDELTALSLIHISEPTRR